MLLGETSLSSKPMHFFCSQNPSELRNGEMHNPHTLPQPVCSSCHKMSFHRSLCLSCSELCYFFPVFLRRSRNKHMPPADTQPWLSSCPNLDETMLVSVTLGPGLIFSAWRHLIQSLLGSHQEIVSRCWLQNDKSISRIKITWILHGYVRYR